MSKLMQPPGRHYEINDAWLDRYATDATRYINLREIIDSAGSIQSTYLNDLITMGALTRGNVAREAGRADFMINGLQIDTAGNINMCLFDDTYANVWTLAAGYIQWIRVGRIYARNTTARGIKICGF